MMHVGDETPDELFVGLQLFDEWCNAKFNQLVTVEEVMLDGSPNLRTAFAIWLYQRRYIYTDFKFPLHVYFLMCVRHVNERTHTHTHTRAVVGVCVCVCVYVYIVCVWCIVV